MQATMDCRWRRLPCGRSTQSCVSASNLMPYTRSSAKRSGSSRFRIAVCTTLLAVSGGFAQPPQSPPQPPPGTITRPWSRATFSTTENVVIVNVSVLDKDGKVQTLQSVELEKLDTKPLPVFQSAETEPKPPEPKGYNPDLENNKTQTLAKFQDRRLVAFLFDFSSMQPSEQTRARDAAATFVKKQLTTSDMVSIMVFGSDLKTVLDFTSDRDLILTTLQKFRIGDSSELAAMGDTGADSQDVSGQFVV